MVILNRDTSHALENILSSTPEKIFNCSMDVYVETLEPLGYFNLSNLKAILNIPVKASRQDHEVSPHNIGERLKLQYRLPYSGVYLGP